jgi:DNA repair exonuclease SbcCD ATPase subunit
MDTEQLQKRIQWIEEDRRKEKDAIALLENRITTLEGSLSSSLQQGKDLSGEITRLSAVTVRMDQYDQALVKARIEGKQTVEDLDKTIKLRIDELEKFHRAETRSFESSIVELQKQLEVIPKLDKNIQARIDVEIAIRRSIDELRNKIDEVRIEEEEYTRTIRLLEDGRRQDAKRIVDLQGEVNALRKRMDDQRGQTELSNTNLHKLDTRINELVTIESERRDLMTGFLDKQAITQVERERTWKEWQVRFDTVEKQAVDIESQLVSLDTTHREVKRAQTSLEELTQRVERRINEITEIQRLSEDRFRQEWVTFKGDDQKRWTNYTLTQEEQRNEAIRQFDKLAEQSTRLEDELQEVNDLLQQANELAEKRLQSIMALAHDWVTTYERTMGHSR